MPEREYCAMMSKANQEDPIGSASAHANYLFVEVPLPWEFQIENSRHFPPGLADVLSEAANKGRAVRLLGFGSDANPSPAGFRRIMHFHRPAPPFASFERLEYVVPEHLLNAVAEAVVTGDDSLRRFDDYAVPPRESRDLFVCTHGNHDVCCGKFGYPIYKEIEERFASASAGKLRVWRTSHFGGHRHAPTLIDFPEGRYWAQMESGRLDTLVLRQGSFAGISRNYRGWGGVGSIEQVAEREMFLREGWDWIRYEKQSALQQKDETSARVRIDFRLPGGAVSGAYEAQVELAGTVQTGGCGSTPGQAKQYVVRDLIKV